MERTSRPHTPITRRPRRNFVTRFFLKKKPLFAIIKRDPHKGGVDAAAQNKPPPPKSFYLKNPLPPLASNDLLCPPVDKRDLRRHGNIFSRNAIVLVEGHS